MLASIGYSSGLVFYDAYLPEIAPKNMTDRISAKGFSYGYAGSVVLLLISIFITQKYELFGFSDIGEATRFVFILVGLWWIPVLVVVWLVGVWVGSVTETSELLR